MCRQTWISLSIPVQYDPAGHLQATHRYSPMRAIGTISLKVIGGWQRRDAGLTEGAAAWPLSRLLLWLMN